MSTMTKKPDTSDPCCCSPCQGLDTYERPLFATGQTLTAADLTALQDYVIEKNRLHNRYQHGWGVVCGLEVLCHDCEGSVTIRPGYALDPCGNDIVVGEPVRYDLVEAIRDCSRVEGKRTGDCDPWTPPQDEGCGEAISYWCVALRFREVETAVTQRLTSGAKGCVTLGKGGGSCGCTGSGGCGGSCGGSCGCGSAKTAPVTDYQSTTLTASNACAPRRVRECFDITIIPNEDGCTPKFPKIRDAQGEVGGSNQALGLIGWLIPERSLLRNIIDCVLNDIKVLTDLLSDQDGEIMGNLLSKTVDELESSDLQLDDVHLALCHTRAAVLELLQDDNGTTRCQLLRATAEVSLPPPSRSDGEISENRRDYLARAKQMAYDLLAAWLQGILDCICRAFLPRCPDNPCDERVELACVTVKAGKIIQICNHSCRKYAGTFPSTFYWMSLIPLIPLFAKLLAMLCCRPDLLRKNSPVVNDLLPLLDRVDPSGKLRHTVADGNFELPRRYVALAAQFAKTPVIPTIATQLERAAAKVSASETASEETVEEAETAAATSDAKEMRKELAALREEVGALKAEMAEASPAGVAAEKATKTTKTRTKPTKTQRKRGKPRNG